MSSGTCNPHSSIFIPGGNQFRINRTYFVDERYGNDSTGEPDNPTLPFQTIGAPSAIAIPVVLCTSEPVIIRQVQSNLCPTLLGTLKKEFR